MKVASYESSYFLNTLFHFKIEAVLTEDVEDLHYNSVVLLPSLAAKYEDVVHVDGRYSLIDQFFENVVHHRLECGETVREAEEHDQRFEKASVCLKGGLPLVSFFDTNIVVSPVNVQLSEIPNLGFRDLVEDVWDQR